LSNFRPTQPPTPAADAFAIHRARVDGDLEIAYVREGIGGHPLLLVHGYPETKRIWWRNIRPLVDAGYEVIVPDLRGYGDSDLSPDDAYDLVLYGRDLRTLVHDVLGHPRCGAIAGDVGGVVICDMANRFPGFIERMIFFNTVPPTDFANPDWYAERGLSLMPLPDGPTGDYRIRQGRDPQALLAELDTPERRRRYLRDFYEHRLWASPGSFSDAEIDFMAEPFLDARKLAASWAPYQLQYGRKMSEMPMMGPVEVPTLVLYGPEDHVVPADFVKRCEAGFKNRIGPVVVPESGHFLQWERADVLNGLAATFFEGCKRGPGR
jgi:pimeloyl-ACP methyl ester carboxylesterase